VRGLFVLAALLATPAVAQSKLSFADIGNLFCASIRSDDLISPVPLLTADLAALTKGHGVRWHSGDGLPVQCMAVGARGTADVPEAVLFMTFRDGKTASDRLILNWVDGQLKIDDVAYDKGGTLRETLASEGAQE
jgi:hypothetical protein